jgi:osmotically-inducible protein OsmY
MQHVAVKVDDDVHIVHLRGTVSSMADRSRAQEVAMPWSAHRAASSTS